MPEEKNEKEIVLKTAEHLVPIRAVTRGPGHYFFGYYDKQQWDPTGRYLLGMRAQFEDRPIKPDDVLEIGMIDLEDDCRWICVADTRSWCWQQGCMLQWRPGSDSEIIFNDRIGDRFVCVILDVKTRRRRVLPRPIYTISNDGCWALSLNFSRLAVTRPGYGYVGLHDTCKDDPSPTEEGVWKMDLTSGDHELILSIDQLAKHEPPDSLSGKSQWINHLLLSPDDSRFIVFHRWYPAHGLGTRTFTVNTDGTAPYLCPVEDGSHFIWYDNGKILIWDQRIVDRPGYYLVEDQTDRTEIIGPKALAQDGHVTVSPDSQWLLTDEYPDERGDRPLILFRVATGERIELGRFHSPMPELVELRCDLHPRWNRTGTQICIDSNHEGTRQMYVLDVSQIARGGEVA